MEFLAILGLGLVIFAAVLGIQRSRWIAIGRPEGSFRGWLELRWSERAAGNAVPRLEKPARVPRANPASKAPQVRPKPRPGAHDQLKLTDEERLKQVESLNRMLEN